MTCGVADQTPPFFSDSFLFQLLLWSSFLFVIRSEGIGKQEGPICYVGLYRKICCRLNLKAESGYTLYDTLANIIPYIVQRYSFVHHRLNFDINILLAIQTMDVQRVDFNYDVTSYKSIPRSRSDLGSIRRHDFSQLNTQYTPIHNAWCKNKAN